MLGFIRINDKSPVCNKVLVLGRNRPEGKILETVGVFEAVKQHGKYETGQVQFTLLYMSQKLFNS